MLMIKASKCVVCGGCINLYPSIALNIIDDVVTIDEELCTECSICIKVCPMGSPYKLDEK